PAARSRSTPSRAPARACASPFRSSSRLPGSCSCPKGWERLPRKRGARVLRIAGTFRVHPPITRGMSAEGTPPPILAYETQARYGPGEAWITLDVSASHALDVDEAFFRRDPWGRKPTEVRVRSIVQQPKADD